MATLGYVRDSNGPDLAQVGVNEQLVSHTFPNTTSETLRITHVAAWVGNWGGTATMRFGIWAASSSSAAPGALLARTQEFSPTVSYVDGAGGQLRTVALESPFDLAPGQVIALGVASRNNLAGIAMYQAKDINRPNENFYRKSISGTNMQSVSGSSVSNEGHLAIYAVGNPIPPDPEPDPNNPPDPPDAWGPVGTIATRTPEMLVRHRDSDNDRGNRVRIEVLQSGAGTVMWDHQAPINVGHAETARIPYSGASLRYYTWYEWRARTRDTNGDWGQPSGWVSFYITHTNRQPNRPGVPVRSGPSTSQRPTMTAAFSDPDEVLPDGQSWDYLDEHYHEIWWGGSREWTAVYAASQSERNNRQSSRQIGVSVPYNTPITYRVTHRDRGGLWSPVREITFSVASGPSVDAPTNPSGRITNLSNPGNIVAVYRNTVGLAANNVQTQLRAENGQLLDAGNISVSVPADGTINVTWAAGSLDPLRPGQTYQVTLQARDTSGNWSKVSEPAYITANARPNTPVPHGPPNGFASSGLHYLDARVTDPDQPSSDLTVTARLYDMEDNLLGTINVPPHESAANRFRVLPSSIITSYQTFKWQMQASDGFLTSEWSPLYTYIYAALPDVEITEPAGPIITTSQPMVQWDSTGQTHWRVQLRDAGGGIVYDTRERSGGDQSHQITPLLNWIDGEQWNNHETFFLTVSVRDSSTLWGTSEPLELTLEYIPPTTLIIDGSPESLPGVEGTHYNRVFVQPTEYLQEDFVSYRWTRAAIHDEGGGEIDGTLEHIADEINSSETVLTDFDVTSNQWYRYFVTQRIRVGVDIIESEAVSIDLMVSFHGTLLHMPFDPLSEFVWLPYGTERYEPGFELHQGGDLVMSMNGRAPLRYRNSTNYATFKLETTFVPRDDATAMQQFDAFMRMAKMQVPGFSPTGRPETICLREGRGGIIQRLYGELSSVQPQYTYTRLAGATFEFTELGEHPDMEGGGQ